MRTFTEMLNGGIPYEFSNLLLPSSDYYVMGGKVSLGVLDPTKVIVDERINQPTISALVGQEVNTD